LPRRGPAARPRGDVEPHPAAPHRAARGRRQRSRVPRIGRGVMDHGDQPRRGRRRLDPGLICYTYVYIGILEGVSGVTELFDGRLVFPDDAGWEEALYARVFNGRRPDRRPDAVLVAASVADVQRG